MEGFWEQKPLCCTTSGSVAKGEACPVCLGIDFLIWILLLSK